MELKKLRVAAVGYTNAWPLTRYLNPALFDVQEHVPSKVAKLLSCGEAELGLIPVGALLSDGDYKVLPGFCIGSDGEVASVLLVGEKPLSEWTAVALDGASRTSVILAQLLLKGPLNRPDLPVYPVDPGAGAFHAQGTTGAVVLGDAARVLPERLQTRIDLGQVWKDWTGLPFVFAVWASREDLPSNQVQAVKAAAERGLKERAWAPAGDRDYLTQNIRYELDDRALMGLRRFAALGFAAGLFQRESFSMVLPARTRPQLSTNEFLNAPLDQLLLAARAKARTISGTEIRYSLQALPVKTLELAPTEQERLEQFLKFQGQAIEELALTPCPGMTGAGWLKWLAIARLQLADVVHIQASPTAMGLDLCQAAWSGGASSAGQLKEAEAAELERYIKAAGMTPLRVVS
jgi:chorismate dehydratase